MKIRLSLGTAVALGLNNTKCPDLPTTGYLLDGDGCSNSCSFCPQAATSSNGSGRLSRVTWPEYSLEEVLGSIKEHPDVLKRLCLQATHTPGMAEVLGSRLEHLGPLDIPICISASMESLEQVEALLQAGADKVSIALDATTPELYSEIKGGDWDRTFELLEAAAKKFPGRIATHLIVGLGETEADVVALLSRLGCLGVTTALFAFTPVPGTAMAKRRPPKMSPWRRMQVANYILTVIDWRLVSGFKYNKEQEIISFGLDEAGLREILDEGDAFRTSGCPDCNRPYYNERPGTELYNYPRPLTQEELDQAIKRLEVV